MASACVLPMIARNLTALALVLASGATHEVNDDGTLHV